MTITNHYFEFDRLAIVRKTNIGQQRISYSFDCRQTTRLQSLLGYIDKTKSNTPLGFPSGDITFYETFYVVDYLILTQVTNCCTTLCRNDTLTLRSSEL
jgi:hypothetical protein